MNFPVCHALSRAPWHDAYWTGVVCKGPHSSRDCTQLNPIAGGEKEKGTIATMCGG